MVQWLLPRPASGACVGSRIVLRVAFVFPGSLVPNLRQAGNPSSGRGINNHLRLQRQPLLAAWSARNPMNALLFATDVDHSSQITEITQAMLVNFGPEAKMVARIQVEEADEDAMSMWLAVLHELDEYTTDAPVNFS